MLTKLFIVSTEDHQKKQKVLIKMGSSSWQPHTQQIPERMAPIYVAA